MPVELYRQARHLGLLAVVGFGLFSCAGDSAEPPAVDEPELKAVPEPEAEPEVPTGPTPTILMVQAQFAGGKPGPAKMTLWHRLEDGAWKDEVIEDPKSSVFHKAVVWRDGILTIAAGQVGGEKLPGKLSHWTRSGDGWSEKVLWEGSWDGKFQRLRDMELADFDGDGQDEIAIATHDVGVVAVADEVDGVWTISEMDETPDTFVHEIEVGDVDGDGTHEFYATPSARNRSSGESQPGGVVRYDFKDGAYVRSQVVHWDASHAKEILVADTDGDGKGELYAVREAHIEGKGKDKKRVEPVKIMRMDPGAAGWTETLVATLDDDQCRFLVPADVDGDGAVEIVAAGYKSGLWVLERSEDGTFEGNLVDAKSGGFEHATHVADLDKDGTVEIYVAADTQKEFRRYVWNGTDFDRSKIAPIGDGKITWNLQDGEI